MTHFYIIRHGETMFNKKGRIQGWCDSPLTDLGVSQAKQLGKEIKNVNFDVCFCSTSERAIDTANYILEGRNVDIIPTKKLKEQSFGDFEAEKSEELGAGEILLTSMDEDGQKKGYDIALTRAVSEKVNIPVIASGGAGALEHFYDAFTEGKADAVLAASLFHFGEIPIPKLKKYLNEKGIPVRL